jgi:hypothetical protein
VHGERRELVRPAEAARMRDRGRRPLAYRRREPAQQRRVDRPPRRAAAPGAADRDVHAVGERAPHVRLGGRAAGDRAGAEAGGPAGDQRDASLDDHGEFAILGADSASRRSFL